MGLGIGCFRFWTRLDQNSGFHGNRKLPSGYNGETLVTTLVPSFLICSSLFLQVMKNNHNISDGFEIRPDQTAESAELAALECLEKSL